ncbi:TraE/TraK family type IV conjugative transfer system protein [Thioalkalivibrio thiocyanodenitrificans]|uniref:TraE/TraK family type IV conjugative transfer system protein n=1 Tax=Thioalkalivibrio thiocyanodenitrificans TaxID=243063 RepID=UPI000373D4BF|nr:TraE/TraK family type IV conjugative transfer system protein [Thioalkalivibrio thiocyanodenitrificans]
MKKRFIDSLVNTSREKNAWVFAAVVLGAVLVVQSFFLMWSSFNTTTTLVPYDFAVSQGPVEISRASTPDESYLTYIALADVGLLLNYSPENVEQQYGRFLNRASPDLYAARNVELLRESRELRRNDVSQSFRPTRTSVINKNVVRVVGTLMRWEAEKLIFSERVSYRIEYRSLHGMPYVNNLTLEGNTDER